MRGGQRCRKRLAELPLVLRVAVGVQQHDGDRLGLGGRDLARERVGGGRRQRAQRARLASSAPVRAKRSSGGTSGAGRAAHRR